jgi:hypothetical protein
LRYSAVAKLNDLGVDKLANRCQAQTVTSGDSFSDVIKFNKYLRETRVAPSTCHQAFNEVRNSLLLSEIVMAKVYQCHLFKNRG